MNHVFKDQLCIGLANFLGIREIAKWSLEHLQDSGHSEGAYVAPVSLRT